MRRFRAEKVNLFLHPVTADEHLEMGIIQLPGPLYVAVKESSLWSPYARILSTKQRCGGDLKYKEAMIPQTIPMGEDHCILHHESR
jgi:hypothetical protein